MNNIDRVIYQCNAETVEECIQRIESLSNKEREALIAEFKRRPDARFGDNLLVALSVIC